MGTEEVPLTTLSTSYCREAWSKALAPQIPAADGSPTLGYDTYMLYEINADTATSITSALQLQKLSVRSRRQGKRTQAEDEATASAALPEYAYQLVQHRCCNRAHGRERLQRVLLCFYKWKPHLTFSPELANGIAVLMSVMETERTTFKAISVLYTRLALDDYFDEKIQNGCYTRAGIVEDAELVWYEVEQMWPTITHRFKQYGRVSSFIELLRGWLKSLLTQTYNAELSQLETFLPLLHHLISCDHSSERDPRRHLRYLAACMIGRHLNSFEAVASDKDLVSVLDHLSFNVTVDAHLLQLILL
eukprot:gnl/TRDRNA2_/TRDRNA2_174575_c0_seq1.p1 gnl/TRDRNA2_/TRDRNA2_174575_c0~~gnl/TRDRNA2_/TRDRNA2_174575_c0_seq1.p1  ORF type:complete len:304 (-),score=34.94 gnl/TRDRNA2_/TRDRNA2_174575_c0_seq1:45-956(-)